ncbi:MAG TPA: RDD family protein [Clostridiales bacterium]|nr:RDD family protein [Clostridiales bacterium]HOL91089.1 RDD family protein [Clostridiales bacterium]HPP35224.1 RDD family protein [Clostridiales bacterium]
MKYAGIIRRGVAIVLDFIFFCIVFFPITYMVKGVWLMQPEDHLWIIFDPICGVFLVIIILYYILLEGITGYTLGKLIVGIRVRDPDGGRITLKQSVLRNLARLVDGIFFNLVGAVIIYKSPLNQRLGDKIAKTVVCRIR